LGKAAVFKSLTTPANPGADADLPGGPRGLARDKFAAHRSQGAKNAVAKSVAQKLAASGVGIWRMSAHISAISINIRLSEKTGLPFLAQPLPFLA
jgi:hypothetical protein